MAKSIDLLGFEGIGEVRHGREYPKVKRGLGEFEDVFARFLKMFFLSKSQTYPLPFGYWVI